MNLTISIQSDTASPALREVLQMVEYRQPIVGAMGRRLIRDTSRHVAEWGLSHPNKLGGQRTNYWAGIAAKINPADCLEVGADTATVTLGGSEMPGLMRAFGDVTITPGTKTAGVKYIPLPARTEAYGMKPREIPGLVLFWKGKGQIGGLAQGIPVTRTRDTKKGKKGTEYFVPGLVMYWFVTSVTQPQDRSLLPSDEEWSESVNTAAADWVDIQLKKIKEGGA